ncbi:myosin regulatory light polypeptide 9 [Moniliophthora roreri]|nr:myosin regulatory light polypeptide 9 [Moniliophthora roreri]
MMSTFQSSDSKEFITNNCRTSLISIRRDAGRCISSCGLGSLGGRYSLADCGDYNPIHPMHCLLVALLGLVAQAKEAGGLKAGDKRAGGGNETHFKWHGKYWILEGGGQTYTHRNDAITTLVQCQAPLRDHLFCFELEIQEELIERARRLDRQASVPSKVDDMRKFLIQIEDSGCLHERHPVLGDRCAWPSEFGRFSAEPQSAILKFKVPITSAQRNA